MKTILILLFGLIAFGASAQALTDDQKSVIGTSTAFQDRVVAVLREKAYYWQTSSTATRAATPSSANTAT